MNIRQGDSASMSDHVVFATEFYGNEEKKSTKDPTCPTQSNENEKVEVAGTKAEDSGGILGVLSEYSENTNFHGFRYIFAAYTIGGR
jgi:hypothetical protein